ncbi:MAG: toxin-antitoxin system YwqK family antitoxin [Sulfurospirillaceae bacterium]|jgi:antitoxin component YwqK of YwqJK toxin-antitoxin module|nr:toxin-antitoxin system YwqK family antitoxin [Sulfurospirillaceae bacterium]MDD2826560.1 toxin-antitoxin system YwqK family antitoxin [Sulfurospirillaceae bacterium]
MKLWMTLMFSIVILCAAEAHYTNGELSVRDDGVLIETKTQKPANGIGEIFYESGKLKSETPFKNGLRDGLGKSYYESGKIRSETPFRNDKTEGLKKEYYESGIVQTEVTFVNDIAEGITKFYYPSGKLQGESLFKNNKADGITKLYSPVGQLIRTIEFKEGDVVKGFDYDAKGNKTELRREELVEATK